MNTSPWQEYELAKANLYRAICARNPQLALFNWTTEGAGEPPGRPVEPREMDSRLAPGAEPRRPHDQTPPLKLASGGPALTPPLSGGGSAPREHSDGPDRNPSRGSAAGAT